MCLQCRYCVHTRGPEREWRHHLDRYDASGRTYGNGAPPGTRPRAFVEQWKVGPRRPLPTHEPDQQLELTRFSGHTIFWWQGTHDIEFTEAVSGRVQETYVGVCPGRQNTYDLARDFEP